MARDRKRMGARMTARRLHLRWRRRPRKHDLARHGCKQENLASKAARTPRSQVRPHVHTLSSAHRGLEAHCLLMTNGCRHALGPTRRTTDLKGWQMVCCMDLSCTLALSQRRKLDRDYPDMEHPVKRDTLSAQGHCMGPEGGGDNASGVRRSSKRFFRSWAKPREEGRPLCG